MRTRARNPFTTIITAGLLLPVDLLTRVVEGDPDLKGLSPKDYRLFVPLELLGAAHSLEIIHPLGYRVQIGGEVNPVSLRQVIQVLDERGAR